MGKNRSKKRRREREQQQQYGKASFLKHTPTADIETTTPTNNTQQTTSALPVSPEELLITVETLQAIHNHYSDDSAAAATSTAHNLWTDVLGSHKDYKDLRKALYPFWQAFQTQHDPVSYPNRVTHALEHSKWNDALFALKGCLTFDYKVETHTVKRGTIQRWVRFVDDCPFPTLKLKLLRGILACSATSDDSTQTSTAGSDPNKHDPQRVLDELLQKDKKKKNGKEHTQEEKNNINFLDMMNTDNDNSISKSSGGDDDHDDMKIVNSTTWCVPCSSSTPNTNKNNNEEEDDNNNDTTTAKEEEERLQNVKVDIVHHVPPADRKPPNHYELKIFTTPPHTIQMNVSPQQPPHAHKIDLVPGALFITHVLTPRECRQIRHMAETKMGFIPDHPRSSAEPTGIDTCEWLVDDSILQPLTDRVLAHVPQMVQGETVAGINARWRLFRYGSHALYRPHIDGSWPGSGLDPQTNKYNTDVFSGTRRSRYTFLLYLNDTFEGGNTTFYLPSTEDEENGFDTVSIQPQQGAVLCFPQGNTATLLHEGSRVTGGDRKYVVRTDILYTLATTTHNNKSSTSLSKEEENTR